MGGEQPSPTRSPAELLGWLAGAEGTIATTQKGHVLSWGSPSGPALTPPRALANDTAVSSERFILNPAATKGLRGSGSLDSAQLSAGSISCKRVPREASLQK